MAVFFNLSLFNQASRYLNLILIYNEGFMGTEIFIAFTGLIQLEVLRLTKHQGHVLKSFEYFFQLHVDH